MISEDGMRITKSVFSKFNRRINNLFDTHKNYIQLRLSVKKITKEFEEMLKDKIEHNILYAEIRKAIEEDAVSIINLYDQVWHSTTMPFYNLSKKKSLLSSLHVLRFSFGYTHQQEY